MSNSTATPTLGRIALPTCFCHKTAKIIHYKREGMVFECHYTNLNLWFEHLDIDPPLSTIIPTTTTTTTTAATTVHGVKNLRGIIEGIAAQTQTGLADSWEAFAQRAETSNIRITDDIDDINTNGHVNKNDIITTINNDSNNNNNNNNNNNSEEDGLCQQIIMRWKFQREETREEDLIIPPKNHCQMIVCGFHMHVGAWDLFRTLVRSSCYYHRQDYDRLGTTQQSIESEVFKRRDRILARKHHRIILKRRDLHNQLWKAAQEMRCDLQGQTIGRWMQWGGEQRDSQRGSAEGGAPSCFCGKVMRLSATFIQEKFKSVVSYTCSERLADVRMGCSRVIVSVGRWIRWQALEPAHVLSSQQPEQPGGDDDVDVDDDDDDDDDDDVCEAAKDKDEVMYFGATSESRLDNVLDKKTALHDGGDLAGQNLDIIKDSSRLMKLKPLQLSAELVDKEAEKIVKNGDIHEAAIVSSSSCNSNSSSEPARPLNGLISQLSTVHELEQTYLRMTKDLQIAEARLKRWQDSTDRLSERAK
ncbi:hypothetical protein BX616_002590 [Lobosporangium transversale]|nr:hypothetical protein BX616_002590 [Lobosporangium transversale]